MSTNITTPKTYLRLSLLKGFKGPSLNVYLPFLGSKTRQEAHFVILLINENNVVFYHQVNENVFSRLHLQLETTQKAPYHNHCEMLLLLVKNMNFKLFVVAEQSINFSAHQRRQKTFGTEPINENLTTSTVRDYLILC